MGFKNSKLPNEITLSKQKYKLNDNTLDDVKQIYDCLPFTEKIEFNAYSNTLPFEEHRINLVSNLTHKEIHTQALQWAKEFYDSMEVSPSTIASLEIWLQATKEKFNMVHEVSEFKDKILKEMLG